VRSDSKAAAVARSGEAVALAMWFFDLLERPRPIRVLWRCAGRMARGPYDMRFNNDVVVQGSSAAFTVAITVLLRVRWVRAEHSRGVWRLTRVGRTLPEALVLSTLDNGPLTLCALQARLGTWTRGTETALDCGTFARCEGMSPLFASVMYGLFDAELVRSFWGARAIRIARVRTSSLGSKPATAANSSVSSGGDPTAKATYGPLGVARDRSDRE
jgi:hypothetical protein